jgi:molybdopterin-guanine dinucleotide biosynthesis protein A
MPFLKESVIEYLIKDIAGYDIIVPRTEDGLQPLHAVYSKNCLEPIKKTIEQKKHKVIDFYTMVRTKVIEEHEFIFLDPMRESFVNVNTPEELHLIKQGRHRF